MKYLDFKDNTEPIGKRKQSYINWAVSKGTDIIKAKKQANKKFGFEKKPGIIAIVDDYTNRKGQNSFNEKEIFYNYDLRKYEKFKWIEIYDKEKIKKIVTEYQKMKWDIIYVSLLS